MKRSLYLLPFLLLSFLFPSALLGADLTQTLLLDGSSYTYSPSQDRFSSPSGPVSPEKARLLKVLLSFANPEDRVISLLPVTLQQRRYRAYCFSREADSDPQGAFFHAVTQETWDKYRLRVLVLDESGQRVKDQETLRTLFQTYAAGSQFSQSDRYRNASSLDSDRPSPAPLRFVQTVSSDLATQLIFADQALASYFTDLIKGGGQVQISRYEAALREMLLRKESDLSPDLGSEIAARLQEGNTYYSLLSETISAGRYSPHPLVLTKLRGMEKELGRLEKDPAMKAFLASPDAINLIFALAEKEAYYAERVEALRRLSVLLHQRKDANPHLLQAMDRVLAQADQTREEEIARYLSDLFLEYAQAEIVGRTQEEILKAIWKGSQPGTRSLARHLLASAVAQTSLGLSVSNLLWGMDAIYANAINAQSAMEIKGELKRIYDQTYQRGRLRSSYPAEYCQDLTALVSFTRLCNASFYDNLADIAGSSALKTALVDQFATLMGGPTLSGAIEQNRQFSAAIERYLEQELLSPPGVEYALKASFSLEPHALAQFPATYQDPVTGMEFVLVRGGCFRMGDVFGDGKRDERPVHEVCVDDFYMGKYEVTVGQFREFVQATGYRTEAERKGCAWHIIGIGWEWSRDQKLNWRNPGFLQTDRHPVVCVSWNDVIAFVEWLSRVSGKSYRLPTEAEWEYAARSGGERYKYSWGNGSPSGSIGDLSFKREFPQWPLPIWEGYDDGYVFTSPVGSFPPNESGLYDMTGNIWEWCSDWYGEKYYGESPTNNPPGPESGKYRVRRGGSWVNDPRDLRASYRVKSDPSRRGDDVGFRLALSAR